MDCTKTARDLWRLRAVHDGRRRRPRWPLTSSLRCAARLPVAALLPPRRNRGWCHQRWGKGFGSWFVRFLNGEMVSGYGSIGFGGQTVLYIRRYDMTIAVQARVLPRDGRVNFIKSVLAPHVLNLEG